MPKSDWSVQISDHLSDSESDDFRYSLFWPNEATDFLLSLSIDQGHLKSIFNFRLKIGVRLGLKSDLELDSSRLWILFCWLDSIPRLLNFWWLAILSINPVDTESVSWFWFAHPHFVAWSNPDFQSLPLSLSFQSVLASA